MSLRNTCVIVLGAVLSGCAVTPEPNSFQPPRDRVDGILSFSYGEPSPTTAYEGDAVDAWSTSTESPPAAPKVAKIDARAVHRYMQASLSRVALPSIADPAPVTPIVVSLPDFTHIPVGPAHRTDSADAQ